jgi:hypothetical protein
MDWSDIKGVIGKAAPVLGTLLGGPAGAAVGGLIASALGTDSTPDAVSAALLTDPTAYEKLQEVEINSKVQLQQLAVTAEQNRLADVQSARARQTANPKDYTPQFLAAGVTIGFFAALTAVMLARLEKDVHDLLLVMIGALQTAWISVISYYFGSSKEAATNVQSIKDVGMAAASAPINLHAGPSPQQTASAPTNEQP